MTQQLYPGFYEEPLLCFADDVVVVAVDSLCGGGGGWEAPRGKKKIKVFLALLRKSFIPAELAFHNKS